jgi:hypothetical protein
MGFGDVTGLKCMQFEGLVDYLCVFPADWDGFVRKSLALVMTSLVSIMSEAYIQR